MILVDYSQISVAAFMGMQSNHFNDNTVDEKMVRYLILNAIRDTKKTFGDKYGEIIICIDNGSWRKDIFPYYKASRKDKKKKSSVDWEALFSIMKQVKDELKETFPYKVIEVEDAEADDIIGVLARYSVYKNEACLIISGDKDFIQLQAGNYWVKQWDRIHKRWIEHSSPKKYLFEHIIRGDTGDGIPNILSPSDTFVTRTRQKPVYQKYVDKMWNDPKQIERVDRLRENFKLIDLKNTPKPLQRQALKEYTTYKINNRGNILKYFMDKGLGKLFNQVGDFK